MNKPSSFFLSILLFILLLPFDRLFNLHVLVIGVVLFAFFPLTRWWQVAVLLPLMLLHDVAYLYPFGLSGLVMCLILFILSLKKITSSLLFIFVLFITSQFFSFLDSSSVQFDTMSIVRVGITLVMGWFLYRKKDKYV